MSLSVGGTWLSISAAVGVFRAIDSMHPTDFTDEPPSKKERGIEKRERAIFRAFGFYVPVGMLASGVALTVVGDAARRRLVQRRHALSFRSHISPEGAGMSVGGRF
ncbi:MAG: hypothetical protein ACRBN8_22320 [Nannocystales bacterium]